MSLNIPEINSQIKDNCNISDSQYWGYLSLCNMLLRLRELYYHENSLRPWEKASKEKVGDWITARENLWETLEEESLRKLKIDNIDYDPFDIPGINAHLESHGYVYGGGYGLLKKPNFFLAKLKSREKFKHLDVYYVEGEICRDLTPNVAMYQNNTVFIRMDIFENYLFQKYMELEKEFHANTLQKGFDYYKIDVANRPENPGERFGNLARELVPILLWHELGEAGETPGEDQSVWLEMLADSDHKLTEIRLRAVKDVLADNSDGGTLKYIIEMQDRGLLYFHLSLIDEARKQVFPEVHQALEKFEATGDWNLLDKSRVILRDRARLIRDEVIEIYKNNREIKPVADRLKAVFS